MTTRRSTCFKCGIDYRSSSHFFLHHKKKEPVRILQTVRCTGKERERDGRVTIESRCSCRVFGNEWRRHCVTLNVTRSLHVVHLFSTCLSVTPERRLESKKGEHPIKGDDDPRLHLMMMILSLGSYLFRL